MVGMAEVGAPTSLDGLAVHPDCWCICLCYLHFAPENPEDGEMYLLVPAHPGCLGQSPESNKMVVCVCIIGQTDRQTDMLSQYFTSLSKAKYLESPQRTRNM